MIPIRTEIRSWEIKPNKKIKLCSRHLIQVLNGITRLFANDDEVEIFVSRFDAGQAFDCHNVGVQVQLWI